jgi:undecaprenyl-diphosphatase
MFDKLIGFDQELERYVYLHHPQGADSFLIWTTNQATIITFSFVLYLVVLYLVQKNKKYLHHAISITLIIGIGALISNSIKYLTKRPRPYEVDEQILSPLVDSGGFSFPSGHTTEVFGLAIAIFLLYKHPFLRLFSLIWAFWIAYTRMALGVHYPLDILGGIITGSLTAYVFIKRISKYLI